MKRLLAKFIGAQGKELNYKVMFFFPFLLEKDLKKTNENTYFQVKKLKRFGGSGKENVPKFL